MEKGKNLKIGFAVAVILLLISVGYIIKLGYNEKQEQKRQETFDSGIKTGFEATIVEIIQRTASCQQVTLRHMNQSATIISVDCLR